MFGVIVVVMKVFYVENYFMFAGPEYLNVTIQGFLEQIK